MAVEPNLEPSLYTEGIGGLRSEEMILNMGPQHPSTHGVLRLVLVLDGETVVQCTPVIGYLHRGMEKIFENRPYMAGPRYIDNADYLSPMINESAYPAPSNGWRASKCRSAPSTSACWRSSSTASRRTW
jgi:NADH-quinone oxidoreductase subunit D